MKKRTTRKSVGKTKATYDVPAVRTAVRLLEVLGAAPRPLGVSDLAREVGTNKNMTYRLLATLQRQGWVAAEEPGPKYRMTLVPFKIASQPVRRMDVRDAALAPMHELHDDLGESLYLGILDDDAVLYIEHLDSRQNVRIAGRIGGRYPLHCSAPGKVLLAFADNGLFDRLAAKGFEPFTDATLCDPDLLRRELQTIREHGWALDNEEFGRGLLCFAAPLRDHSGAVVGAIGTSVTTISHTVFDLTQDIGPRVLAVAAAVSQCLGADRMPPDFGRQVKEEAYSQVRAASGSGLVVPPLGAVDLTDAAPRQPARTRALQFGLSTKLGAPASSRALGLNKSTGPLGGPLPVPTSNPDRVNAELQTWAVRHASSSAEAMGAGLFRETAIGLANLASAAERRPDSQVLWGSGGTLCPRRGPGAAPLGTDSLTPEQRARIARLRRRQDEFLLDTKARRMGSPDEARVAGEIAAAVYSTTRETAEVLRRAEFLEAFAQRAVVRVEPGECIVGSQLFNPFRPPRPEGLATNAPWFNGNIGHIVVDYGRVLRLGVCGLRNEIEAMPTATDQQRRNRDAFARSLDAFAAFIRRHAEAAAAMAGSVPDDDDLATAGDAAVSPNVAPQTSSPHPPLRADDATAIGNVRRAAPHVSDRKVEGGPGGVWTPPGRRRHSLAAAGMRQVAANCERIGAQPPETFWQALQLTWFVQVFLHAEASAVAFSFGRLDQFLWPFLERDLAAGVITLAEAEELLACFWLKCCEGDESQNLVVGGIDAQGRNAENPLSLLCLKVTRELRVWQPSVSVRTGPETSEAFWTEALQLCAAGFGMPSFFNDPVVIRALEAVGIPETRARDWGIVGCYEASPQGDCCSQTVAGQWVLPNVLLAYLDSLPSGNGPATFPTFSDGLKSFMAADFAICLQRYQQQWNAMALNQSSPFESLCLTGCTESGLTAEEGGARFSLFGVNILGLGTLVDSLHVVEQLVYGTGRVTLDALRRQLKENFADTAFQAQCRNLPGKYGTDTPATNALAAEFANHIADVVLGSKMEHGVRPYPALFIFTGWAHTQVPATPDGRRAGDTLSYGIGPSSIATGRTPTSVLASAALAANDRCACGNPLLVSFNRNDIHGDAGRARLRQTIETYFRLGGFHVHFNLVDADQLRAAKANPQEHADLLVRISGLSAQFVTLDERLQNGLIERTEQGL
ncbi:MAG: hypothetical protein A3K19_29980 [Lentisphaerae bacterium RIFOXYB12_FULL_65_16]|nr:MAG: hypothetical protein A3K18_33590 [Lentisphaerae bacterium RIFOXYA12_64_32]OGV86554.1 MAG: hypothetical protein A3K19_29980 [Lentisphaerae bacterium RIFOXYB12_FULL_65_16]